MAGAYLGIQQVAAELSHDLPVIHEFFGNIPLLSPQHLYPYGYLDITLYLCKIEIRYPFGY